MLEEAEDRLETARRARRDVDEAGYRYTYARQRFRSFLEGTVPKTRSLLARLSGHLTSYVDVSLGGGSTPILSTSATGDPSPGPSRFPKQPNRHGRPIVEVELSDIDLLSGNRVTGSEDFRKVSYEQMLDGCRKLDAVVRPAVASGATADYFSEMDQREGLGAHNGYRAVYDAFYGDPIALDLHEGRLRITDGSHRLHAAKQIGLTSVPAIVLAKANPNRSTSDYSSPAPLGPNEVYFCGKCNRQNDPSGNIRCPVCNFPTVSWNLRFESHAIALKRWQLINGAA